MRSVSDRYVSRHVTGIELVSTSYHRLTIAIHSVLPSDPHRLTTQIGELPPLHWTPKRFIQEGKGLHT